MGGGVLIPEFRRLPPTRSCVRNTDYTSPEVFKATDERLIGEPCITCGSKYICNCDNEQFVQPPLAVAYEGGGETTPDRAELSLIKQAAAKYGGIVCDCDIPTPLGPAGLCDACGVEGPQRQQIIDSFNIQVVNGTKVSAADDCSVLDRYKFVNLREAYEAQPTETEWVIEPILAKGTLNVLYATPGHGKSLVALEEAAKLAWAKKHILYLDNENRIEDHVDRLTSFGWEVDQLEDHLHILSFSDLPDLSTPEGGEELLALARAVDAYLVVIDTRSRFIEGDEDKSGPYLAMYNNTLKRLKGSGFTTLMLDHPGKNLERGARGSSAKKGDIDTEWALEHPGYGEYRHLECTKSRQRSVKPGFKISLRLVEDEENFRHEWLPDAVPASRNREARTFKPAILEYLTAHGESVQAGIKMGISGNNAKILADLRELVSEGVVSQRENSGRLLYVIR